MKAACGGLSTSGGPHAVHEILLQSRYLGGNGGERELLGLEEGGDAGVGGDGRAEDDAAGRARPGSRAAIRAVLPK